MIRGIAALEVCLSHLRAMFFVPYMETKKGVLIGLFYFVTGFGHQSVIIFFVLSGFLISRSIHYSFLRGKWSVKNYSIDRLARLWVVIIPGLILTWILDHAGLNLFPSSAVYSNGIPFLGDLNPAEYLNVGVFLGNVFFLQTIWVHTFGSNGPLWSLANEFWYYVLFPILYFACIDKKMIRKSLLFLLAFVVFAFTGIDIAIYFFVWLIGFGIVLCQGYFGTISFRLNTLLIISSALVFLIILVLGRGNLLNQTRQDFYLAVITGILVYGLINAPAISESLQSSIRFLSGISFSLYVIHFPIAAFLSASIVHNPSKPSMKIFSLYIGTFLVIFVIVSIFWYLFESRYIPVRKYVKRKLAVA